MHICSKDNSKLISWFPFYYWIAIIVYLIAFFIPSIRTGVVCSFLILPFVLALKIRREGKLDSRQLFFLYFLYNILSVTGYLYNGIPIKAYIQDFSNQLLPMIFFCLPSSKSFDKEKYYDLLLGSIIFCILVGLYLYIRKPDSYFNFLERQIATYNKDYYLLHPRFNSFLGSTIMGTLGVIAMIISLYRILYWGSHHFRYIFLFILSFGGAILTMQRSAMVIAIMLMFMSIVIALFSSGMSKIYLFFTYMLFALLLAFGIFKFNDTLLSFFGKRIEAINIDLITSRSDQWFLTIKNSPNIVFGSGLGSVGHKALGYAKYVITDGSLFKIFAEFGIFGFLLFLAIVSICLEKAIRYKSAFFREIAIIIVFLLQSIGSNSLSFQLLLPMFWLSLGIISFSVLKKDSKYEDTSILFASIPSDTGK